MIFRHGSIDSLNNRACFHRPVKQDIFCLSKKSGKWAKIDLEESHSIDLNVIRDVEINPFTSQVIGLQILTYFKLPSLPLTSGLGDHFFKTYFTHFIEIKIFGKTILCLKNFPQRRIFNFALVAEDSLIFDNRMLSNLYLSTIIHYFQICPKTWIK